eukprot:scaffold73935_cov48-Phaeocystis_antarctica.AAC.1
MFWGGVLSVAVGLLNWGKVVDVVPHDVLSALSNPNPANPNPNPHPKPSPSPSPSPNPHPHPSPSPHPNQVLSAFTTSAVLNIMFTQIGNLFQIKLSPLADRQALTPNPSPYPSPNPSPNPYPRPHPNQVASSHAPILMLRNALVAMPSNP